MEYPASKKNIMQQATLETRTRRRRRHLGCEIPDIRQQSSSQSSTRTTSEDFKQKLTMTHSSDGESAADRLAMPLEIMTTTATGQQQTTCHCTRRRASRPVLAGGLVFCSVLSTTIILLILLSHITLGAVIRPTIFSDLPPDSPSTSAANGQAAAQQPAAISQQQPSASSSSNQIANSNNNNISQQPRPSSGATHQIGQTHWQQHTPSQHHPHQADGPQTPKIIPLKSRFCAGGGANSNQPLGMQSYAIDDLSLSASSFSNEQVRPHLARLNLDVLGGAWCPMKPISASNFGKEWIQVKLNRSFVIGALETQGRFAMGSGKEFVPSYQIEYSRDNGLTWHKWKDFLGSSLLRANEDVNTGVRNELSPPIVGANVIRILPFSAHLRTVCLRFELYGCQYDEGAPISYSTNDGVVEPRWGHLIDYTYDGLRHRSHLSGGLGQLVDGVKGPDNFSFNNGFEWVGWKKSVANGDVVIEFTFKTLRNFTGALFHSNNLFSSGVEVFQGVDVHYGIDVSQSMESLRDSLRERERRLVGSSAAAAGGALSRAARQSTEQTEAQMATGGGGGTLWSQDVLSIEYEPDKKAESSRPVTVHLKQRLANKLRFHLKFASKWILLSEVEFLSRPVELMSLASLSEQMTPRLMGELTHAKTYDQYVAILREHQLRRLAADEYLLQLANGGSTTSTAATVDLTTGTQVADTQQPSNDQSEQQQQQQQPPDNLLGGGREEDYVPPGSAGSRRQVFEGPATNPFLNNLPPPGFELDPSQPSMFTNDKSFQSTTNTIIEQQQVPATSGQRGGSSSRTLGLATVISFVFVALLGLLGLLFAISSYRLRSRGPKLGSPTALPRHALTGTAGTGKSFMSSVFVSQQQHQQHSSSSDSSADSSAGSFGGHAHHHLNTGYLTRPAQMAGAAAAYQSGDSHYNPLFASASGHSSEGSLRRPKSSGSGPLSSLRKLASLTTGRGCAAAKEAKLRYQQQAMMQAHVQQQQQPSQLLVSLKDSISSTGGGKPFTGATNSQAITAGQLIVGLNQANPLAHQQIYNQQQPIYGQQHYNSNSATNSMSLTASSSSNNPNKTSDFSPLTASGDYATPDLQAPMHQQHHSTMSPFAAEPFGLRASTRLAQHQHQQQQRMLMAEHNYEQISGDQQQQPRFTANTLHHAQQQHHQRTFSNQMLQQHQVAGVHHNNGASTMCPPQDAWRQVAQRQPQPPVDSSSHYYYADTEAAKSGCPAAAAGGK